MVSKYCGDGDNATVQKFNNSRLITCVWGDSATVARPLPTCAATREPGSTRRLLIFTWTATGEKRKPSRRSTLEWPAVDVGSSEPMAALLCNRPKPRGQGGQVWQGRACVTPASDRQAHFKFAFSPRLERNPKTQLGQTVAPGAQSANSLWLHSTRRLMHSDSEVDRRNVWLWQRRRTLWA